jgi:hypothetical protein
MIPIDAAMVEAELEALDGQLADIGVARAVSKVHRRIRVASRRKLALKVFPRSPRVRPEHCWTNRWVSEMAHTSRQKAALATILEAYSDAVASEVHQNQDDWTEERCDEVRGALDRMLDPLLVIHDTLHV